MTQEDRERICNIINSETIGYAYVYPLGDGVRKEYMLSLLPENLADFIGTHGLEAEKIIVTDIMDRLVVDTQMWFLDNCPDQKLCRDLIRRLAPIQMGQTEPGEILAIDRDLADEYFQEEDQRTTMMELGMQ